jgi:hypothetical protein
MRDLAPEIHRQRLVVEGLVAVPVAEEDIKIYLKELGCLTQQYFQAIDFESHGC